MISTNAFARRLSLTMTVAAALVTAGLHASADAAFRLTKVVDSDTPVPGGGGTFAFFIGSLPHVSGDWVVFNAATDGGVTIWRSNLAGRQLKRVITNQMFIPGWKDQDGNRLTFNQNYGSFMRVHGETLVVVALPFAGATSGVGIFTRSLSGGPISKLVDKKDEHPDIAKPDEDKHFGNFSDDFAVAEDLVVFSNRGKIFNMPITGGAITASAGASTEIRDFRPPCPLCPNFDTPSLRGVKVLLVAGNVLGKGSIQSVRKDGARGSWSVIAKHGTRAPGTPSNYGFIDNQFWGPVLDQTAVFGGASTLDADYSNPAIFGIYSSSDRLRRLADTNMPVPGGVGNFVFSWGGARSPILAKNGIVVFGAQDADNKKGLYAVPQTGGRIRKIIAVGDTLDGRTVSFLDVGRGGLDGSTLVFTVGFTNFDNGIYTTEIVLP